jgi:restriction endonuclease Mrr
VGTVQHEGAAKGILVTTSKYGRDAYDFISNKSLVLIDGQNLLAFLAKVCCRDTCSVSVRSEICVVQLRER